MQILRYFSTKVIHRGDFYPSSRVRVFRKSQNQNVPTKQQNPQNLKKSVPVGEKKDSDTEYFENLVKVQMLSKNLHQQIFPQVKRTESHNHKAEEYIAELRRHGIDIDSTERIKDVLLKLPAMRGANIQEHFHAIAEEQVAPYKKLLLPLVECKKLPEKPNEWLYRDGWTAYDVESGTVLSVAFPEEDGLIFDVEVCVTAGSAPILATAVSTKRWYSWVSPKLFESVQIAQQQRQHYTTAELIPMGKSKHKIIVGHNVSYDRARLLEQYLIEDTGTRFVDTMSLHVCVSGITSYQRALLKSKKETAQEDLDWQAQSSLNSLVDVHRLYCGGEPLSKEPRNIFIEGTLEDVRANFQSLMNYCAGDVEATQRILHALYPMYAERFPHPATFAGMLEMGSAYLPVNTNWERYIREADLTYEDLNIEAKYHLGRRADEACALLNDEQYRKHLWLWDEDWSTQALKMKKPKKSKKLNVTETTTQQPLSEAQRLQQKFQHLYDQRELLPTRRPLLPGYPQWYRKLCLKPPRGTVTADVSVDWAPGATEVGTGMQIAPKLLSLCWEGYPLHYNRQHGWGFLVPFRMAHETELNVEGLRLPIEQLAARCPIPEFARACATAAESDMAFDMLPKELDAQLGKREFYGKNPKKEQTAGQYKGSGVWCNYVIDDCAFFLKLPHKNGKSFRVGNPLSKDFLNKFAENVLSSGDVESNSASRVIEIARMMSYWRNNRDRILGQMVVWLRSHELSATLREHAIATDAYEYGAICPQVVACGTLTRRAMEPTWMTASNSRADRIGSELRAMVQAPPNYKIVGADVDSQELWIASVLGDAYAHREHGATPLGWMTLSGSKSNGTDMHSITAKAVGISRDHAKVINYARIYGAGQNFAEGLLKQFNPTFSSTEAKSKAMKMFAITKGKRVYRIREEYHDECVDKPYTTYEAMKMSMQRNRPITEVFHRPSWQGGTESAMFNRLEEIASGSAPVTPFLGCRLSRALETNAAGDEQRFLPTRVNWVVQSGAVDFLHLMLVAMRWLMGPHVRFCLSFHDELRYLVKDEHAYKAALAMHITNLLTRAFCAASIGLKDLPMSVAFFSSVEVDTVLRKECTMDCKTPSNPHGLHIGYGIPAGESLNIYDAIEKSGGNDLSKWTWIK